jgi:hypothetical protein
VCVCVFVCEGEREKHYKGYKVDFFFFVSLLFSVNYFSEFNSKCNFLLIRCWSAWLSVCLSDRTSHCQWLMMYLSVMVCSPPETKQRHEFSTPLEESCKAGGRGTASTYGAEDGVNQCRVRPHDELLGAIYQHWLDQVPPAVTATCARLFDSHI